MYLICYMDRSNISVAQPEIGRAFGLDKTSMGLVHLPEISVMTPGPI